MIPEILLPEFDFEMAPTRKLLAVVPDAAAAWRPHAKSMSLGELAQHIANLVAFGATIVRERELDKNPPGGPPLVPRKFTTTADLLAAFDDGVKATRAAIEGATDAHLMESWSYKNAGKVLFITPRASVLRGFLMNHVIHHRGQLSVYLRLCDVPLPSIYGPTADAPM